MTGNFSDNIINMSETSIIVVELENLTVLSYNTVFSNKIDNEVLIEKPLTDTNIFSSSKKIISSLKQIKTLKTLIDFEDLIFINNQYIKVIGTIHYILNNQAVISFRQQNIRQVLDNQIVFTLKNMEIGLWLIDLSTMRFQCNINCPLYPIHSKYFKNYNLSEYKNIVHPDDYEYFKTSITNYLNSYTTNSEPLQFQFRATKDNNEWEWILFQGKILEEKIGEPKIMIAIHQQISKIKLLTEDNTRKSKIIHLLSDFAQTNLKINNFQITLPPILKSLGIALDSDSVYLFRNIKITNNDVTATLMEKWYKNSENYNQTKDLSIISYKEENIYQFIPKFQNKEILDLSANTIKNLQLGFCKNNNIQRFISIPIVVEETWWGNLIIEYYHKTMDWNSDEINSIKLLTSVIGLFIRNEENYKKTRQNETELLQTSKQEALGALAGGVAHDLNNILSPILGFSSLILEDLNQRDPHYEDISIIHDATLKAKSLISKLMYFNKTHQEQNEYIEINDFLLSLYQILKQLIRENITVDLNLHKEKFFIFSDRTSLSQLFLNLIVNAQEAIDNEGSIVISINPINIETLNIQNHHIHNTTNITNKQYVKITIKDTGYGINPNNLEHIFDSFYTTKDNGTGLGLAIVKSIINKYNWIIDVKSKENKGTEFTVYMPIRQNKENIQNINPQTDTNSKLQQKIPTKNNKIIVVEDDISVLRIVTKILKRKNFEVIAFEHPIEALNHIKKSLDFDLILTDVVMPKMNGRELIDEILKLKKDTKYIYMSGHTDNIIGKHGVLTQHINFLHKPFTIEELILIINKILNK